MLTNDVMSLKKEHRKKTYDDFANGRASSIVFHTSSMKELKYQVKLYLS